MEAGMSRWQTPWTVGVIIPACNEQETIEACIASVLQALHAAEVEEYWIVVIADDCHDRTVERAQRALGSRGEVAIVKFNSAGAARRAGVARVRVRFAEMDLSRLWLANTDADTTVSESWIRVQLLLAEEGVTGV